MRVAPGRPSLSIVLVEDDASILTLLREALEADGFAVQAFSSAFQALASLRREMPSVLVLDWHLPEMNGRALLDRLREYLGWLPPVLVLTGDVRLRVPSDVVEVLRKPVSLARVADRVRALAAMPPTGLQSLA